MPRSFSIRAATENDISAIFMMITELAVFLREPDAVTLTEKQFRRDFLQFHPAFNCFVAEDDTHTVCGYALYHSTYSTWQGRSMYLEDLYVQPHRRLRGIDLALLARVAAEAESQGCARLEWSVLLWNKAPLRISERVGAIRMEDWRRMRLTGEPLSQLAAQAAQRDDGYAHLRESSLIQ